MKVPFLDLQAHHRPIMSRLEAAMRDVLAQGIFAGGPFVEAFEEEFASFCGCRHAVGVGSGTDAIWLALAALGIGRGDEVVTVPNSFIATAEAISMAGATPVFVDVDERTYTLNPRALRAAITPRTRAIVPVHLFGQMADMDAIQAVAAEHRLLVIEDACQAHGATYRSRSAGSVGLAGCFSFYPGKNLGALGEAGAVTTDDEGLADEIRMLRDHGQRKKYIHAKVGWNARMDGMQAAVLRVKLARLRQHNEARRQVARMYRDALEGIDALDLPAAASYGEHVYHLFAVRSASRARLIEALAAREIGYGIHYPVPIHLQAAYSHLGLPRGSFPVAERCAEEFLSLPMYPELRPDQIASVAATLTETLAACRPRRVAFPATAALRKEVLEA